MDTGDLRIFEAVARLGGMNRAAAALNTGQANVTARVKALEADLGCVLSERRRTGVSLTAAGRRLLPYADGAARLLTDARRAVRDDGVPRGVLTIGSLETTAALRLTPLLAGYAADYPDVDLVLRTGTTRELIGEVLEGRVDAAFVCGPVAHADLLGEAIFREELIMLTARNVTAQDEMWKSGEVSIVVLRAGCSYRQMLEALLARRGVTVRRKLEHIGGDFRLRCSGAEHPPPAAGADRPRLGPGRVSLHPLPPADAMVDTVFIRRRDGFSSSALKAFVACAAGRQKTAKIA